MNSVRDFKPFPIPVVSADAPSDFAQDDGLDYLAMPKDMETYRPPMLPEPEDIARQAGAVQALHQVLAALRQVCEAGSKTTQSVSLVGLQPEELTLINQVLGEGEVSAQVLGPQGTPAVHIQESVFAGVEPRPGKFQLAQRIDGVDGHRQCRQPRAPAAGERPRLPPRRHQAAASIQLCPP